MHIIMLADYYFKHLQCISRFLLHKRPNYFIFHTHYIKNLLKQSMVLGRYFIANNVNRNTVNKLNSNNYQKIIFKKFFNINSFKRKDNIQRSQISTKI